MSVQVFRGRTVVEARQAALEALGPDALLVSTRQVVRPGVSGLFGGSDFEVSAAPSAGGDPSPSRRPSASVPFALAAYGVAPPPAPPTNDVGALRAELKGDIRALKTMLNKTGESSHLATEIEQLRELLEFMAVSKARTGGATALLRSLGIEGPAAATLARALPGKAPSTAQVREAVKKSLTAAPWPLTGGRALIGLVGPSGVGKTTTAAKLGAHARSEGKSVTFVACDAYRVGAVEQLSGYGRLMGAEVLLAKTSEELRAILESARADVVIVDTSGRPPMANGPELALARGASSVGARARHVILCATATLRPQDANRIARRFASLGPTEMAITKIDETGEPAGLLHGPWASKLPVSVLCFGQRVPEDISAATPDAMVDYLAPARDKAVAA